MKELICMVLLVLAVAFDLVSAHAQEVEAPQDGDLVLMLSEYADLADRRIALLEADLEVCEAQRDEALSQVGQALELAELLDAIAREQARAEQAAKRARRAVWASVGVSLAGAAAAAVVLR